MTDQAPEGVDPDTGELVETERVGFDFLMFVSSHRRGAMNVDITEAMDELITQVMNIGKKGTISITLTVTPLDDVIDPTMTIEDEVKIRPPKRKAESSAYFLQTADGQISRRQPQQAIPGFESMKED